MPDTPSRTHPSLWAVLAVVVAADIMDLLDASMTSIAAPVIEKELGGGHALISWLGASYALALGVLLVLGGRLGDKYGQRRIFLSGIAGFTLASALCAFAVSPAMLITGRLLQGGFGALLVPQGFAILKANFDRKQVSTAFSAFGPLLGVAAGLILCANSMPSRPNVASTKTIRKRERRELPAMYRNPRAGTWRDPATPSERSITFEAPVLLDANGRWGLHRSDGLGGRLVWPESAMAIKEVQRGDGPLARPTGRSPVTTRSLSTCRRRYAASRYRCIGRSQSCSANPPW